MIGSSIEVIMSRNQERVTCEFCERSVKHLKRHQKTIVCKETQCEEFTYHCSEDDLPYVKFIKENNYDTLTISEFIRGFRSACMNDCLDTAKYLWGSDDNLILDEMALSINFLQTYFIGSRHNYEMLLWISSVSSNIRYLFDTEDYEYILHSKQDECIICYDAKTCYQVRCCYKAICCECFKQIEKPKCPHCRQLM
jgi:hypothetical protein